MTPHRDNRLTDELFERAVQTHSRRLLAIARAIVSDPTFLLCDEPTGDLDRKAADEIMDLVTRLVREFGKTVLMVTHDPAVARRAQATLRLEKGSLVGAPEGAGVS